MAKPFQALRQLMQDNQMQQAAMARRLAISSGAFGNKINARQPFIMQEAYTVLKVFDLPPERLPEFFPPDGVGEGMGQSKKQKQEAEIASLAIELIRAVQKAE